MKNLGTSYCLVYPRQLLMRRRELPTEHAICPKMWDWVKLQDREAQKNVRYFRIIRAVGISISSMNQNDIQTCTHIMWPGDHVIRFIESLPKTNLDIPTPRINRWHQRLPTQQFSWLSLAVRKHAFQKPIFYISSLLKPIWYNGTTRYNYSSPFKFLHAYINCVNFSGSKHTARICSSMFVYRSRSLEDAHSLWHALVWRKVSWDSEGMTPARWVEVRLSIIFSANPIPWILSSPIVWFMEDVSWGNGIGVTPTLRNFKMQRPFA